MPLRPSRDFMADTTAPVLFFMATGILNERLVAGMSWHEVATARLIGAPLVVLTARPYGIWRGWLLDRAVAVGPAAIAWDAVALMIFQVPIYVAIIWAGGATGDELWRGAVGAAAIMLCLGRPYGLFLDWVRGLVGLPPGGMTPMSPGG